MKTLKVFYILCIAFCISSCSSIKLTEEAPFKVTGATYHSWVGGQPGVSGVNVIIGIKDYDKVTFKTVYFQNRKVNAQSKYVNNKPYLTAYINTSPRRIAVEQTITYTGDGPPPRVRRPRITTPKFPFNLEPNEAVIKYMVEKKTFYYKVSKIKKTKTVFYP
jgi:hypothetical protein